MKKLMLVVAVGGLFALASCKKDYKCDCTYDGTKYTYDLKDVKKKDAKDACNAVGNAWVLLGGTCALQ